MLSPPALTLLTIGSFGALYDAWFNYPRYDKEISLALCDIIIDAITVGIATFGIEWFHRQGLKLFSWVISIIPILLVIGASLLIIIVRLREEKSQKLRIVESPAVLSLDIERRIEREIERNK